MLKKFEATDGSGSVFVNPEDVSTVKYDGFNDGVRIKLKTGEEMVVEGVYEEVAMDLGYVP